jgi:hypothetical protein
MRVCASANSAKWPSVIWEVYAPESLGGAVPLGDRRSICTANNGGRWVFHESGVPYEFEDVAAYSNRRKKDRFTRQMLDQYLTHFGLSPFSDNFYVVTPDCPAVILERPKWPVEPPEFTLEEVLAGKPWQRA